MRQREINGWVMQEPGWWTKDRVGGVCNERGGWTANPYDDAMEPTRWPNMRTAMRVCEEIALAPSHEQPALPSPSGSMAEKENENG